MCVIVISPKASNRPTLETLKACEASNRDGGGVAWLENGKPTYRKGVDAEFIHDIMNLVSGPVVAHFRIATVGGVKPVLCHPFPISPSPSQALQGQHNALLFHNGTWSSWEGTLNAVAKRHNIQLKGEFSDSRASALVASIAGLESLNKMGGKFCVIKSDGAWMFNGGFSRHEGNWYSNMWWQSRLKEKSKHYASYHRSSLFDEASDCLQEQGRLSRQAEKHLEATPNMRNSNIRRMVERKEGLLSLRQTLDKLEDSK